ncbi:hypothetical protein ACJRO7_010305 [Eucalyptus globulus]|uniref:Peptidase A1 domain-containing protein n=1 Tax=Eucalyptus globulus TaxID=34317 RepID=A0ABD3LF81_EUCGL
MASLPRHHLLLLLCCFSCLVHSSRSRTLVLPLARDASTLRYVATVYHGPSLDPLELAVDLGGPSLWLDCSAPSSGYSVRRVPCRSIQCLAATSDASGLRRACPSGPSSVCGVRAEGGEAGVLGEGALAVDSVDGSGERSVAAVDRFLISCARAAPGFGASGVATAFGLRRRFFACLSASEGIIVAGDGPFFSHLDADISKSLTYTPLATARSPRASDYLINLTSIKINGKRLPLNSSSPYLIQLSAEIPYTAVASPIYSALAEAFAGAASAMGMASVPAVAPFGVCFDPRSVGATAAGPDVPAIDLVLQSEMVRWRIGGSSSMVRVSDEATCLGVVDGGDRLGSWVVLGGHQLEDVLLEFDFGGSRLGFSPSLSTMQLSCSNFRSNFNSMALSSQ